MAGETGGAVPTIYAPITAVGRSAVTGFRVSGPLSGPALQELTGRSLPPARVASVRWLRDPRTGDRIDQALVVWMPGPASFTGQDVVELHTHGGRAVAVAVMTTLSGLPGMVLAEPGAFSRQAFDAGRLDLAEAEAIADLVAAETEAQRRQALRQMEGALGRQVADWTERLTRAAAYLEAAIDFADESLPDGLWREALDGASAVGKEVGTALGAAASGIRLREGVSIALVGPPNVGKSSLLNALAAQDVAIVTERAGTTRDVVEVRLDLDGWPVVLADTAGLRDSADEIEAEGVRRALRRAEAADVTVLVLSIAEPEAVAVAAQQRLARGPDLVAWNKCDVAHGGADLAFDAVEAVRVSARSGEGLETLTRALARIAGAGLGEGSGLVTRARHVEALEFCLSALDRMAVVAGEGAVELVAHEVRCALNALGRLTGAVGTEQLLDLVFRDFCIGK